MRVLRSAVLMAIVGLSGCATFHQAREMRTQATQQMAAEHLPPSPPVVQTVDTPYLLGSMVKVGTPMPAILRQTVTLVTASPMTIGEIAAKISSMTGIPVDAEGLEQSGGVGGSPPSMPFSAGVLPPPPSALLGQAAQSASTPLSLHYSGPLSGLLDAVAAKECVWWRFRDGRIVLFRTETKTFQVPALAWSTQAMGSIVASAGANANGGSSGSGAMPTMGAGTVGGSGGTSSNTSTGSTAIVNSSSVNVWSGLQKIAQTVAGSGAQVIADAATGSITVTGTPPQVRHVYEWVQGLSRQLSRQVAITVHVYDVQVTNEQNYGLNLSGAFQSLGKQYGISVAGVAPPTPVSGQAPFSMGANILSSATGAVGQWSGSQVAVQALATLGNVSQVFEQSAVTLNGQPAPIQVAQQVGYLASSSSTQTANVGTTSGLIPGTVTTGFTAMFLPRVVDGKILLGMNMTISSLLSIQTVSSGGNSIQVPSVASSTFQQSVSLKPGQTLLLTGFKQNNGQTTRNGVGSPYMPLLGGGADANIKNQMIAIVITARIL